MNLITLRNVCVSIGNHLLLDHINLTIRTNEKIALIGRNGAGKSTLMKLLSQNISQDEGEIIYQTGTCIARIEQEVPQTIHGNVFSVIAKALGSAGQRLAEYLNYSSDKSADEISHSVDIDWNLKGRIEKIISELELNADEEFFSLSGGMKRRVLLGCALVQNPDVLLLDEPTNHLDINSILWLENFLAKYSATLIFITHDRALLQKLATRIIELDRGVLTSFPGDYTTYLQRKEEMLETEAKHNALFDKKLVEEEVWIRQGIKARRTRNEGRVRALKKMREMRSSRRDLAGNVSLKAHMAERSSQLVLEAKNICYMLADQPLIFDFSTIIHRGDKVGIIGPNGCGKSTLLNLLLGKIKPTTGNVKLGENLKIAYFDQLREAIDLTKTVADNVMEGSTLIEMNGEKKHIISYLQDFLFTPDRARSPVKILSGGEKNRLLLARLFAKPSNFLVMDEPTNDLDAETLELLEELLIDYPGTIIVVSHDRSFLNNVATSIIAFEGEGRVYEYVGGYDDWQRQKRSAMPKTSAARPSVKNKFTVSESEQPSAKTRLTYSEQHQLKNLENEITTLENQQTQLQTEIETSDFYNLSLAEQQNIFAALESLKDQLAKLYERWEMLESKR